MENISILSQIYIYVLIAFGVFGFTYSIYLTNYSAKSEQVPPYESRVEAPDYYKKGSKIKVNSEVLGMIFKYAQEKDSKKETLDYNKPQEETNG